MQRRRKSKKNKHEARMQEVLLPLRCLKLLSPFAPVVCARNLPDKAADRLKIIRAAKSN
jgi:hypothetical protein